MKKHKLFALLLALALTASILLSGCAPGPTEPATTPTQPTQPTQPSAPTEPPTPATLYPISMDWEMTAYMVNLDGTVESSFPLRLKDTIRVEDPYAYHKLVIRMPEDVTENFRYYIYYDGYIPEEEIDEVGGRIDPIMEKPGDFAVGYYVYDKENNEPGYVNIIINVEKGYLLAEFDKGTENWPLLMACTNPNEGPADVLAHFQEYLQLHRIEIPAID